MSSQSPGPSFEDLYKQLEEKVALLEQGGLSLDDSLAAYEEAVGLAQKCQELLDGAELRITKLRAIIQDPNAYAEPGAEDVELDDEEVL